MVKLLAIDIGAESGRAILGTLEDGILKLKEIHRFQNGPINILGSLHWNIYHLYQEIIKSIAICVKIEKVQPDSIGIDTWGVDYLLMNKDEKPIGLPYAYRDSRTDKAIEKFSAIMAKDKIYELTGIQFMQFNTLFQLFAEKENSDSIFNEAATLLFIPDIFNYLLTGVKKSEFTFATTSQLYNPQKNNWDDELFTALGISKDIMQDIVQPGTIIGHINKHIQKQTGVNQIPVIAVASHDTGSAIAAIPAMGNGWAYLSSGTWSLMGIESKYAIINEKTYQYNFTNEGGVDQTFTVLKNITGLWLLQECRKSWSKKKDISYDHLVELALKSSRFVSFINPDDQAFFNPLDMPSAIKEFCQRTNQQIPENLGGFVQIILESLALKYRHVLDQLNEISANRINRLYITGGGIQNILLNQYIADATGLEVVTALSEGTAAGNTLVQAKALGITNSLTEIRQVISRSIETQSYQPKQTNEWNQAYTRFLKLL
jgi:rhamnulokinase